MEKVAGIAKLLNWWGLAILFVVMFSILKVRSFTSELIWVMPKQPHDFMIYAGSILIESMPFVLLGIFLSIVVQVWLPRNFLSKWLPKNGILRRLYISCFGVFLPVCECGNLPLARGLVARGFSPAESLTFLLAAPILNPITIITTHQAFQTDNHILIARVFGALVIANVIGWLFSKHAKQKDMLTPDFIKSCEQKDEHSENRLHQSLALFSREARIILPALCIGAIVAGLVQVLVPRSVLLSIGGAPVLSILVMMVVAFTVAICSNVDAFFALAFSSTFSVGSIAAFLVFGPMIDIKMLSLMRTTYTTKTLIQVSILVALMSLALGLAVNYAF
jgi:uncharacterized membrane protein YraQ (UPF0718 family)